MAVRVIAATACALALLAGAASAKPREPKPAQAFVDSIGVNTHFGNAAFPENAYANRQIGAKLAALGVRHVRDHTYNDAGLRHVDDLHRRYGIRATLVLGETTRSPAELVKLLKAHPAYEAIEGLNEPDFADRTYKTFADDRANGTYAATRAFQEELYAAVKADPRTKALPVLSPAMGRSSRSPLLLPIPFDVAAMHRYAWEGKAAMEPAFGLDEAIANMAKLRGDKPLWATESGYYNEPGNLRSVPEAVAGKYVPRLVGEFFNRGIARTYLYELADQGPDKSQREQNFGLLRHDMTEKPAYAALKNLIALLNEPKGRAAATAPAPTTLDYQLDPPAGIDLPSLSTTLLQKRDGRLYLLLWQQVSSYDAPLKRQLTPAPLNLTLTLPKPFSVRTYLPTRSKNPTAEHPAGASVPIAVPDEVLVVELSP